MRHLVFDTETTGLLKPSVVDLAKQPKVIELGLAIVEGGKIVEKRNWLIDPGEQIEPVITKITGIAQDQLTGQKTFNMVFHEAYKFFNEADSVIAHNLPFDKGMIDNEMARWDWMPLNWPPIQICTVREFQPFFGRRPKLTDLYERYVGKPLAQTHRAIDDVEALVEALLAANFFSDIEAA